MNRRPRKTWVFQCHSAKGFLAPDRHPESKITVGACLSMSYVGFKRKTLQVAVRLCRTFTLITPVGLVETCLGPSKWAHNPCPRLNTYRKFLNFTSNLGILNSNILHERLEWEHYSRKKVASITIV